MVSKITPKNTTPSEISLLLYAEMDASQIRQAQRLLKKGELRLVSKGIVSGWPEEDWPELIARERIRVLAALLPGAVYGYRTAFNGGQPEDNIVYLNYSYPRTIKLPGLVVVGVKGAPALNGDMPMQGKELYFPSEARVLLENLTQSRGERKKSVGREAVEARLLRICESRGEEAISRVRELARSLAPLLDFDEEFKVLDAQVGSILGSRPSQLTTAGGKALAATMPYDPKRLALFEKLAARLRSNPLRQSVNVVKSHKALTHFAFLESYFSNFIEGTEFEVEEARAFVLGGKPIAERPKDSHDILGVFQQIISAAWRNQVLAAGEPVLVQLRERHANQMHARPEIHPGEFKVKANRAGNTEFVAPAFVRGTLVEGSRILASVPAGTARALLAMFLISEVHPFNDGNGRLARLLMNAELSVVGACRIIVPTLYRDEYLDCLRVLTRDGEPEPFVAAMQKIHEWTASFDYENLDIVINSMKACNAFEKSRVQFQLLNPEGA